MFPSPKFGKLSGSLTFVDPPSTTSPFISVAATLFRNNSICGVLMTRVSDVTRREKNNSVMVFSFCKASFNTPCNEKNKPIINYSRNNNFTRPEHLFFNNLSYSCVCLKHLASI